MATIRLVPSTYYLSNSSYLSVTSPSSMYANTDSTDFATVTNTRNNSTTSYYIYIRGFNFSAVPNDAIVSNISIKLKAYHSNGNTSTIYGYNGTTQVSAAGSTTALTTSATVQTFTNTTIDWDTLKGYGDNFGIRINCRRSNRSNTAYVYIYGAEIEVTYTLPVYHTITSSTSSGTISPSGATSVLEGSNYTLTISGISNPIITDNNTDVTSQRVQLTSGTTTLIPNNSTISGFTSSNISNAYTDATSTTSATLNLAGGNKTGTLYLDLGGTAIPSTATIQSVSCTATLQFSRNNSSSGVTASFQLYSGSTAKGSSTSWITSATDVAKTTYTLTTGTWSASEIANAKFYLTATNNASSTQRIFYVYGVSFNVTYELNGVVYTYTISNVTSDHTIVVSGGTIVNVTGISLDYNTATIQEESTYQLTATISPSNASNKTVTWSSNNTAAATVNSSGLVTAVAAGQGTATITATTVDGGYTATCVVTITAIPTTEYVLTSTLVPGKTYLVANGNSGSVYLMSNEAGASRQLKGVAATVSNNKINLKTTVEAKCAFDCVLYTSGNDITTTLVSDNKYLYTDSGTGLRFQTSGSLDRFWHYEDGKFWQFKSTTTNGYTDTSSEYKYYLEWDNNGNFTDNHVTSPSISDTTLPNIYLFIPASSATEALYYKNNGSWVEATAVYKKVNGSWVLQNDLSNVFDASINYVKG